METKVVLEGITVGGKTLREHLETINHQEAIFYVEEIVQNEEELTEWKIKIIHKLILKDIEDQYAGTYRDQKGVISGAEHTPPDSFLVNDEMELFIQWYDTVAQALHPIERASMVHILFVGIHPFIDGNGRTARLLLNLELMKVGYPPIIIKKDNRLNYYKALDKAHTSGGTKKIIEIVVDELNTTLDLYFDYMYESISNRKKRYSVEYRLFTFNSYNYLVIDFD